MITIHSVEQGSEEWHQAREGKYTGSNADKLLRNGRIPYSQATRTSFKGNQYTKRGHILEPECIELYEKIRNVVVERSGYVTNDKYPDCLYSPDGLMEDRIIEVKAFNELSHMKISSGEIPFKILAQCHFGMFLCEKRQCDLLIYNPDLDPEKYGPRDMLKIIQIKSSRDVRDNFERILKQPERITV